jgi:hypothetical protein
MDSQPASAGFFIGAAMPNWIPRWAWFLTFVVAVTAILVPLARAVPIASFEQEDLNITLTDEECALPQVANLPKRAIWREPKKTVDGCWGVVARTVVVYWADKTVILVPAAAFTRATSI